VKNDPQEEAADLANVTMASLIQSKIVEVGSVKPVDDFTDLMKQGQPFRECESLIWYISTRVVFFSTSDWS
jgi:hypothetical protein